MFAGTVVSHDAAQARGLACAVLLDANDLPLRLGPTSAHVCAPENATDTPIESGVCKMSTPVSALQILGEDLVEMISILMCLFLLNLLISALKL